MTLALAPDWPLKSMKDKNKYKQTLNFLASRRRAKSVLHHISHGEGWRPRHDCNVKLFSGIGSTVSSLDSWKFGGTRPAEVKPVKFCTFVRKPTKRRVWRQREIAHKSWKFHSNRSRDILPFQQTTVWLKCLNVNVAAHVQATPEDCTVREKLLNTGYFRRLEHLPSHVILLAFNFVRCPCSRSDIMPP